MLSTALGGQQVKRQLANARHTAGESVTSVKDCPLDGPAAAFEGHGESF